MIITVTVNPCLDVVKNLTEPELGRGTFRPIDSTESPGGKGIDVSRGIKACGSSSTAIGFIGGYTGRKINGLLQIENIHCDFVEIGNETRTNVILNLKDGVEIRINSEGPSITGVHYGDLLDKIENYGHKSTSAAICGSVCEGMKIPTSYCALISGFKKANKQCYVYLDTGEKHTLHAIRNNFPPDFIKPNIKEFDSLINEGLGLTNSLLNKKESSLAKGGKSENTLIKKYCHIHNPKIKENWETLVEYYLKFVERYPDTKPILSISELGAICIDNDELYHCYYCGKLEPSPTSYLGAGDSLLAGFITQFEINESIEKSLKLGVAAATARVMTGHESETEYIDPKKLAEYILDSNLKVRKFKRNGIKAHLKMVVSDFKKNYSELWNKA